MMRPLLTIFLSLPLVAQIGVTTTSTTTTTPKFNGAASCGTGLVVSGLTITSGLLTVTCVKGAVGLAGPPGAPGSSGAQGPPGPAGPAGTPSVCVPGFGIICGAGAVSINTAVVVSYPDAMAAAPFDCVSTGGAIAFTCNLKVAPSVVPVMILLTVSVNCLGGCTLAINNTGIKAIKTNAAGATDA